MTEGRLRRAGEFVVRHEGLALTLGYLVLAALGMFHSALYFVVFRVNFMDFAEVSDFLLAPLRDPLVVIVSVLPLLLLWFYHRLTIWSLDRWPWLRRFDRIAGGRAAVGRLDAWLLAAFLWVVAFNLSYVNYVTDRIKDGHGASVAAAFADGTPIGGTAESPLLFLRGTSKYAFFYRPVERQVVIVPLESLSRIVVQRPPPRSRAR